MLNRESCTPGKEQKQNSQQPETTGSAGQGHNDITIKNNCDIHIFYAF